MKATDVTTKRQTNRRNNFSNKLINCHTHNLKDVYATNLSAEKHQSTSQFKADEMNLIIAILPFMSGSLYFRLSSNACASKNEHSKIEHKKIQRRTTNLKY